jgi:SAM-dependent methyltransferase
VDRLVDGSFDVVLLMGPMYHLLSEDRLAEAVTTALRVLKPGGTLFVSFISLFAGFCYYMKEGPEQLPAPSEDPYVQCVVENRSYCGPAFTDACFIAPHEIVPFMSRFPLEKLHLLGQEGITSPAELRILACDEAVIQSWLDVSLQLCEREEFFSYSEHLMYIGRRSLVA